MMEMEQDLEIGGVIPSLVPLVSSSSQSQSPNLSEGDDSDDYHCEYNNPHHSSSQSSSQSSFNFQFRPIVPLDRARIQALHEDWFPVSYHDEFYDELVQHRMAVTGELLYTCVAVAKRNQQQQQQSSSTASTATVTCGYREYAVDQDMSMNANININTARRRRNETNIGNNIGSNIGSNTNIGTMSAIIEDEHEDECEHDDEQQQQQEPSNDEDNDDDVAACVVGCFINTTKLSGSTQSLLVSDRTRYKRLFYIMTLGTVSDYRQCGLGTALIENCMEQVERDPSCGVLYLHVITHNLAAIRFYEKLGFLKVQEIPNYYTIDGELFGCFLYAKYYHGELRWTLSCVVLWWTLDVSVNVSCCYSK
jgi:ribosomal protein S18 acetylase RimI-like enzyme